MCHISSARPVRKGGRPDNSERKKEKQSHRRPMLSLSSFSPLCSPEAHSPPISSPAMRDGGGAVCWRDGADIVTSPLPSVCGVTDSAAGSQSTIDCTVLCDLSHVHGKLGTVSILANLAGLVRDTCAPASRLHPFCQEGMFTAPKEPAAITAFGDSRSSNHSFSCEVDRPVGALKRISHPLSSLLSHFCNFMVPLQGAQCPSCLVHGVPPSRDSSAPDQSGNTNFFSNPPCLPLAMPRKVVVHMARVALCRGALAKIPPLQMHFGGDVIQRSHPGRAPQPKKMNSGGGNPLLVPKVDGISG